MTERAPHVRGQVILRPLADVSPNPWNPNRMTDHVFRSVVHGLREDGWVASQALLVWASDENGEVRDVIIDGEHRWRAARECGFVEGPMVMLHGVTEHEAKALTVKLNQKRGDWDDELLAALLQDLQEEAPPELDLALDLGIEDAVLEALTAAAAASAAPQEPTPQEAAPPTEFKDLTAEGAVKTNHRCPRCTYEWSGPTK